MLKGRESNLPICQNFRNVTSAVVVAPITQGNLACMSSNISALAPIEVTGPVQKGLLQGYVSISKSYLGSIYDSLSTTSLKSLIAHADGCGEGRGVDGSAAGANGVDFVTTCNAQNALLACFRVPAPVAK